LIRASQLTELGAVAIASMGAGEEPWEIGVVFDMAASAAAAAAGEFHAEMDPAMTVAAAEAMITDPSEAGITSLFDTMSGINPTVVPFLEVDRRHTIEPQIAAIRRAAANARRTAGTKLRCGGITSDLFPPPGDVASFIVAAVNHSVPFKATAGLHQPFRHFDADLGVHRHGFVNLIMATTAAAQGADLETVTTIVAETDMEAFSLSAAFGRWRDLVFPGSAIRRSRVGQFIAYGSCDFDEPIEALSGLGLLGEGS
jgi:hypothetical protein